VRPYRPAFPGLNVEDSDQTFGLIMPDSPAIRADSSPDSALIALAAGVRRIDLDSDETLGPRPFAFTGAGRCWDAAGIASITGATLSVVQAGRAANTGGLGRDREGGRRARQPPRCDDRSGHDTLRHHPDLVPDI